MHQRTSSLKKKLLSLPLDLNETPLPKVAQGQTLRDAAVLVLFAQKENRPYVLFTKRSEKMRSHKNQIAFPGGAQDPGEDLPETALRETYEELGIESHEIEIISPLPAVFTSSRFRMTPFLANAKKPCEDILLTLNTHEISSAMWMDWEQFLMKKNHEVKPYEIKGRKVDIHYFYIDGETVWGATGGVIWNLVEKWGP